MPSLLEKTTFTLSLLLACQWAVADEVTQEWERLIRKDFKDGCVTHLDPYLFSSGTNGVRGTAWLVQTCEGNFEYGATYLPPDVHPEELERISVRRKQQLRPLTPVQLKRMYF
jgi:hypothetical protein